MRANRYEVLVNAEVAEEASRLLGAGGLLAVGGADPGWVEGATSPAATVILLIGAVESFRASVRRG